MTANPRRSNGSLRDSLRERIKQQGLPCALCGHGIDYSLPAGTPWSFEVDEDVPVSRGGSPFEWSNLQPAHRRCNQLKGDMTTAEFKARWGGGRAPLVSPVECSREW